MYGYTGTYKGKRISVQGTGMGMPSASIYLYELMNDYGVKSVIRVGTCGAIREDIGIRDIIIAMTASTNSNMNKRRFGNLDFAPCADFDLLHAAYQRKEMVDVPVHVGGICSNDSFYEGNPEETKLLASYGVMAYEMETTALYTLAAKFGVKALTLLTVSDSLVTHEETSAEERQNTFLDMMKIALEII